MVVGLLQTGSRQRPSLPTLKQDQEATMSLPAKPDTTTANAKHKDAVWSVAWTRWNQIFTGSVDETARVWSADLEQLHVLGGQRLGVISVAASPNEQVGVTSSMDCVLRFFDLNAGTFLSEIQAGPVEAWTVAWSPVGSQVAAGTQHGSVNVWNVQDLHAPVKSTLRGAGKDFIHSVAFSPDGRQLAAGCSKGQVYVFDLETETLTDTLQGHTKPVRSLVYTVDGYALLTASDDGRVNTYEMGRSALVGSYTGHSSWVLGVAACPDGRHFASCGSDKRVKIWDLAMKDCLHTIDRASDAVWCVAFCPEDPNLLVYGTEGGEVTVANVSQHIA